MSDALDLMHGLVLEDGRRWGATVTRAAPLVYATTRVLHEAAALLPDGAVLENAVAHEIAAGHVTLARLRGARSQVRSLPGAFSAAWAHGKAKAPHLLRGGAGFRGGLSWRRTMTAKRLREPAARSRAASLNTSAGHGEASPLGRGISGG